MIGKTVAHYKIVERIGAGGMGEVYRASDSKLGRDVALKVLPADVARDDERMARFRREAQLLASLNHPHIGAIYGIESSGDTTALVLELIEGPTLEERIRAAPLPLDDALDIARQIADAVEAAHDSGIVHRDLKPMNVKITPEGRVKVLDFGLAKALHTAPASGTGLADSTTISPALTSPVITGALTGANVILGTAAYMSPEQARGSPVDRRADVWAFGVIVYEMLTGSRLFQGETVSDTLAEVLKAEPDWDRLPTQTPLSVRRMLRRCLAKNPVERLRSVADAVLELDDVTGDDSVPGATGDQASPVRRIAGWLPWAIAAGIAGVLLFGVLGGNPRGGRAPSQDGVARRLTIPITGATQVAESAAPPVVSPDGRWVAYGMTDDKGVDRLWLRPIDSFEAQPLAGTEGAAFPFWSPDSKHVGFFLSGLLKKLEVESGRIRTIGGRPTLSVRGASWGANDQILFVPNSNTGVWLVDAAGGEPRQITTPESGIPDASHRWPHFLPDGDHYLFLLWTNDTPSLKDYGGVYLASISNNAEPLRILPDASSMSYASGRILVMRENTLVAVPFDASTLEVTGGASVVTDNVLLNRLSGHAAFSASSEGTLVYARDLGTIPKASFLWCDREGNRTKIAVEPTPMYSYVRLSPDGQRVATLIPGSTGDAEVWVVDLVRGVRTRLVPPAHWQYESPIWSPDGNRVLYVSAMTGTWDFYTRNIDGSGDEEPFLSSTSDKAAYDWHGDQVLYAEFVGGGFTGPCLLYDMKTKKSTRLFDSPNAAAARFSPDVRFVDSARFSPDGRFVAYFVSESGRPEVFIQSIGSGARWQVSTSGGESPHWSDDGREIIYLEGVRRVMAVPVDVGADDVTLGRAKELFQLNPSVFAWDVTGDHQRVLLAERTKPASEPIHVILNWDAEL